MRDVAPAALAVARDGLARASGSPGVWVGIGFVPAGASPRLLQSASSVPRSASGSPSVHMSQSKTATQRPGSSAATAMLSRRQSLWRSVGGGEAGRLVGEPARELVGARERARLGALVAVEPAVELALEEARGLAPERVEAEGLRVDRVEVDQRVDHHLARACGWRARRARRRRSPARCPRTTTPRRRSITTKGAPMTAASSQKRSARGAGGKACQSTESARYSRAMSWAPGATGPERRAAQHVLDGAARHRRSGAGR